jgi:hypothetical protein
MQIRTQRGVLGLADGQRPEIHLELAPRSSSGHLFTGIAIGVAFGFIAGSVLTVLIGEKSLLLAQHLWNQITHASASTDGDRVHFEWLLQ